MTDTPKLPPNYLNLAIEDFIEVITARIASIIDESDPREIKAELELLEKLIKLARSLFDEPLQPKPTVESAALALMKQRRERDELYAELEARLAKINAGFEGEFEEIG
jgi:hypothetical protein